MGATEPTLITLWLQRAVKEVVRSKGIPKRATCHTSPSSDEPRSHTSRTQKYPGLCITEKTHGSMCNRAASKAAPAKPPGQPTRIILTNPAPPPRYAADAVLCGSRDF